MTNPSPIGIVVALAGALLVAWCTWRAARSRQAAQEFRWMVLAGVGYVILASCAAASAPRSDGFRAAMLQGAVILLAAALGKLSLGQEDQTQGSGRGLASATLFIAWLALLGLPPTAGFHARVLVYRSLLQAGWTGILSLSLALTAVGLIPALNALALGSPGTLRGGRAVLAILLALALLVTGLYPAFGLSAVGFLSGTH